MKNNKAQATIAVLIIVAVILAVLYIIGKTAEVVREENNDNKTTGELTGIVARKTAEEIGQIVSSAYDPNKGSSTSNTNNPSVTNTTLNASQ